MGINDIYIFNCVAKLGSISSAAQHLNYAQSNITTRMKNLENNLETVLFHRSYKGIKLTPKGKELLEYSQKIIALFEEAQSTLSDNNKPHGDLLIGSMETTAGIRLPMLVAKYCEKYDGVNLMIKTGTTDRNIAKVLQYQLDGAFVAGPVNHSELISEPVIDEQLVIITDKEKNRINNLSDIANKNIIVFKEGFSYRKSLENLLSIYSIKTNKTMEFGTLDGILGCVAVGLGVTLLPYSIYEKYADNELFDYFEIP